MKNKYRVVLSSKHSRDTATTTATFEVKTLAEARSAIKAFAPNLTLGSRIAPSPHHKIVFESNFQPEANISRAMIVAL